MDAHTCTGHEIDAHDAVIRFNLHPTGAAFAQDIGSRTDIRVGISEYQCIVSVMTV